MLLYLTLYIPADFFTFKRNMFLTPLRRPVITSPPAVIPKRAPVPRFTDKMRGLEFPEHIANDMTTFEKGCYYATTTRDVTTMQVFFLEVVDVYAETIVYRIAPQSLRCLLTLETAKNRLQHAECKVASVDNNQFGIFFEANQVVIYASLLTKLD